MKCMNKVCRRYSENEENNCLSYLNNEMWMCSHKVLNKAEDEPNNDITTKEEEFRKWKDIEVISHDIQFLSREEYKLALANGDCDEVAKMNREKTFNDDNINKLIKKCNPELKLYKNALKRSLERQVEITNIAIEKIKRLKNVGG